MNQNAAQTDYRVNTKDNNNISIEIRCCGQHIGEVRFKDSQFRDCPQCGVRHLLRIEHNHFHISQFKPE
ncbi:MAG: hypothetical protein ACOY46_02090 [Bacillota bacterium]